MLGMALGLGTTLMMSSCGGGVDVVSEGVQPVFAGSYDSSSTSTPCYWEGTLKTDLNLPAGGTGHSAYAYSPVTSTLSQIYTPGTWSDGTHAHACYWKGAEVNTLTDGGDADTYATSITVSGTDVYVGGYYNTSSAPTVYIPCYWKNGGAPQPLKHSDGYTARVTGIGVTSASLVVCSGYYTNGTGDTVACYWNNTDTRHDLNLSDNVTVAPKAMAYGIVVANNDLWIVGHYTSDGKTVPCCWKGTKAYPLSLPTGAGNADVYAISTKGSDASGYLYCAGYYHDGTKNVPIYWGINNIENTTPTLDGYKYNMSAPNNYDARAYAIFSSGDDLWIGGNYLNTASGSSVSVPCYWKDGGRTNLTDGTSAARIACGPDVP
jgi:hypothetical protein